MEQQCKLYFIPSRGEFLKIQQGTGDNLLREDIEAGFTDYVLWSTFKPICLDIDGELEMECTDSGMVLIKGDPPPTGTSHTKEQVPKCVAAGSEAGMTRNDILESVLEQAYDNRDIEATLLIKE